MSKLAVKSVCTKKQTTYIPNPFNDRRVVKKLNLVWVQTKNKMFMHSSALPDGIAFNRLLANLNVKGAKIDTKYWIEVTQ